jgi:hypothetical protein
MRRSRVRAGRTIPAGDTKTTGLQSLGGGSSASGHPCWVHDDRATRREAPMQE